MSAYSIILFLHSWLRWVVLILALVAIVKSLSGWLGNKPFTKSENGIGGAFVGTMHLQLVLGLLLYFVFSAYGFKAISAAGMGEVMKDSTARFWGRFRYAETQIRCHFLYHPAIAVVESHTLDGNGPPIQRFLILFRHFLFTSVDIH